jgi:glycosyltransferase involved in cell wall biosynthesis
MPSASPTGGAEEAFWQFIKSDSARSIQLQSIFLEDGPLVQQVQPYVRESFVIPCGRTREIWKWWTVAGQIKSHSQRFGAQLIFGWMTKGHVYGGLAAWRAGIPAAWFQMGLPDNDFLGRASRWLPARAVFACSKFVAREQQASQPKARVIAVPLGFDLARFDLTKLPTPQEAKRQLGLPLGGPLIGIVGRLQSWKGIHVLIEAMPIILESHADAHCLVVGGVYPAEPMYEIQLHELAGRYQISDQVIFAGARKDVPLWMQAMDVFVHASRREPFGIVVIEAMALGKPVVACAPGGTEEMFSDNIVGALIPFADADLMAKSVLDLVNQGSDALARNPTLASRFSSDNFAKDLLEKMVEVACSSK